MTSGPLDPTACALFLTVAFSLAGLCQAVWLSSAAARAFGQPLDGRCTWRGRRVFGDNKTVRGVVAMVPATAVSFGLVSRLPGWRGIWPLPLAGFAAMGALAAIGFMAGELPNSFVKRQLGIAPGQPATGRWTAPLFLAIDRLDSPFGLVVALSLCVTLPAPTAIYILTAGPILHALFSLLTFRLGGKARAA